MSRLDEIAFHLRSLCVSPAKVSVKHLPPEGEMARMEVTVTHEVTPQ